MPAPAPTNETTVTDQNITQYLLERVPQFRRLTKLREKGWRNPAGDEFFKRQRHQADHVTDQQAFSFYNMMKGIGREIHSVTNVFDIRTQDDAPPKVLDMCMAPGAFLSVAMEHNPRALAQGFTLPLESGGHKVLLPPNSKTTIDLLDINMLAADMGVDFIPPEHPDAHNFLPRHLQSEDIFDLVLCDGNVLRTHPRAAYRDVREAARLVMAQLTMALEHMKPGGTILVLMHKMESWKFVLLLRTISRFSIVQVFKPRRGHAKRSSCYLVASNIQPQHEDAVEAVRTWKQLWKTATFGTEDEYEQLVRSLEPNVEDVLEDFGPRLIELGRNVWKTQADALATAPFVRNSRV